MLSLRELERAAAVLRREIVGHRVQEVAQPDATSVVLELYGGGGDRGARRRRLVLSCDAERARVGELRDAPGGARAPRFAQYLRAHVRGARIRAVEMQGGERQLALRLDGNEADSRVGRRAARKAAKRPRSEAKLSEAWAPAKDGRRAKAGPCQGGGGERTLLLAIFGRRSNIAVLDAAGRIAMTLRPLADTRPELEQGGPWQPPGRTLPRAGEDRFAGVSDAEYLFAIEAHYAEREQRHAAGELRRRIDAALRKEQKSLERKLEKVARELARAEDAARLERHGELLKSAQGRVARGDREVVVRDWDSGADVRIELDPMLGPAENLERLFARYRKGVRALAKAGAQEIAVRDARDAAAALARQLAAQPDGAELDAFAARPEIARLLKKYAPPPPARREPETRVAGRALPAKLAPRRYRTAGGLEIWVGRSDAANDYLTTRLARGKDLFFHVAATPGTHVILRTEGRDDPPSDAILDACELAAHFSKAKRASRVDVHVVLIRNVRKPKGAKPGLVEVHGGRNVHLRREQARLRRVLDARIED